MLWAFGMCLYTRVTNMALLHEEKLLPEAIAEGNNDRIVIKPLVTQVYKHIPRAQSIA